MKTHLGTFFQREGVAIREGSSRRIINSKSHYVINDIQLSRARGVRDLTERVPDAEPMAVGMERRALRQDRSFANLVHDVLKENVEFEGRCVLRAVHGDVHRGEYTLKGPPRARARSARETGRVSPRNRYPRLRASIAARVI